MIGRLERWARYKAPNAILFCWGVGYVVACVIVLVIGYPMLLDAADDLKRNAAYTYDGASRASPCGLPGTDALPLLQAFNRHERGFLVTPLIEPSYNDWMEEVEAAICNNDYGWQSHGNDGEPCERGVSPTPVAPPSPSNPLNEPASPPPPIPPPLPPGPPPIPDGLECLEDRARELRAIAQLAQNWTLNPRRNALANHITDATIDAAEKELIDNVCQDYKNADGHLSFYSKRLRTAYGDLQTRVARAYVAAAPSFYRYRSLQTANSNRGCLGEHNPFMTNGACDSSDHVNYVLQEAGTVEASARLAGVAGDALPPFQQQVYALLALSVVSHIDRTLNNGECFRNQLLDDELTNNDDTVAFCEHIYADATFGSSGNANPMVGYATVDADLSSAHRCSVVSSYPPAPPNAPPFLRDVTGTVDSTAEGTKAGVEAVCANLLQYGLFDQGRLFGIPDVLRPFTVDVRKDASSHFLAHPIYDYLYVRVVTGAGENNDLFHAPVTRLEAYMAYRLASMTIWGMLIASVVGFFLVRAAVPLFVQSLRLINIRNLRGNSVFLTRPPGDATTFIAAIVAGLAGYWTLFVDPAVQSNYPITTDCTDWLHGDVHSSSGAYVTSWGKRRFDRMGESRIGIALWAMVPLPFVYSSVAGLIDGTRIEYFKGKKPTWAPINPAFFYVVLGLTIVNLGLAAGETVQKGHDWYQATFDNSKELAQKIDTLADDCRLAVMIAFWSSALNGAVRSRWTVDNLQCQWKVLWFVFTLCLVWAPIPAYTELLDVEWQGALQSDSTDKGRQWRIILLLVCLIGQTIMVTIMFNVLRKSGPTEANDGFKERFAKVEAVKTQIKAEAEKTSRFTRLRGYFKSAKTESFASDDAVDLSSQRLLPDGRRFSFKFTDAQFGGGVPDDTGHTIALPAAPLFPGRRHNDEYLPMLKFKP